jgi:phage I-like protein
MNPPYPVNTKSVPLARTFRSILADASKELPTRIEIMKAGSWPEESNKGHIEITLEDLQQYKTNFDKGLGMPGGAGFGLPLDFMHEEWDKAAGWIKQLDVEGTTLFATVEWTDAGRQALQSGEFKCFSPSFYPSCLGEWHDPEDWNVSAKNVLIGGGLTNIPFFKGLTPITASNSDGTKNVMYVKDSEIKEKNTMPTLAEVLNKEVEQLNDEDKKIIADNIETLTADQRKKYGYEVKAIDANKNSNGGAPVQNVQDPEVAKFIASINSGENVVVKATEYKALTDQVSANNKELEQIRLEKVQAMVETHHARGAIKSDRIEPWVKRVMADATMEEELKALPDNADHAKTRGQNDAGAGDVTSASAQFEKKVSELMEAHKDLEYSAAVVKAATANPELSKKRDQELRNR